MKQLDQAEIGARIRHRRKALGISQPQLSLTTGIASGNISGIETGRNFPSAMALYNLAEALQCSTDYILTGASVTSFSDETPQVKPLDDVNAVDATDSYETLSPVEQALVNRFRALSPSGKIEVLAFCLPQR